MGIIRGLLAGRAAIAAAAVLLVLLLAVPSAAAPRDPEVRTIVDGLAGPAARAHAIPNLTVAISWRGQRYFFFYTGTGAPRGSRDDVVEIGSITKVFTTLLLADAFNAGRMAPTDPIQQYLPGVRLQRCTAAISLLQMADFRSGLPELPGNLPPTLRERSIDNYTRKDMLDWLAGIPSPPGDCGLPARYLYSNASVGILGDILANAAGVPWEAQVAQRITGPLGMTSTAIHPPVPPGGTLQQGHQRDGSPAIPWPKFAWFAAGGLRSTAVDMLNFGAAALGHTAVAGNPVPGWMAPAFARAMTPDYTPAGLDFGQGMAWAVQDDSTAPGAGPVAYKDGGTDGFNSVLLVDKRRDLVVFVVGNKAKSGVPALGLAIVRAMP